MGWLNIMAIIVSILLIATTIKYMCIKVNRDHWRRSAVAALGHVAEIEAAISRRCEYFGPDECWCNKYDCVAMDCAACFVQRNDGADLWRRKAVWLACKLHRYGDEVERFPDRPDGTHREHDNYRAWLDAADAAVKDGAK